MNFLTWILYPCGILKSHLISLSVSFNKSLKTFRERQFYSSSLIGYRILLWAYLLDHVIVNLRSCLLLYSLNWEENKLSIKQSIYTSLCVFQFFHNLKEIYRDMFFKSSYVYKVFYIWMKSQKCFSSNSLFIFLGLTVFCDFRKI